MIHHALLLSHILLQKAPSGEVKEKGAVISHDAQLPPELDFFKYAKASTGKRKAGDKESDAHTESKQGKLERKRRKIEYESKDDHGDAEEDVPAMQKHRVTSKGSDVPKPITSFEDLRERYHVSPRLLSNLSESSYKHPTGIQAHGIPILLEVSPLGVSSQGLHNTDDSCSVVTLLPSRQLVRVKLWHT
jgi:ATP-dependent RNA helicase DDX52/ROK1